jgi:hypothetical protein
MSKRSPKRSGPRVLFIDIETAPVLAYVWSLWDQNVALNQIKSDWSILSFAAKWLDDPASKVIYHDVSKRRDLADDTDLCLRMWKLLNEADIVVAQNGEQFDRKKINARLAIHGFKPPAPYSMFDTLKLAKRVFGFTSNKLEYLSQKLNRKHRKLKHARFAGFDLWRECLARNPKAWAEMRKYNVADILALEELYRKMAPWDTSSTLNFSRYRNDLAHVCRCGSNKLERRGYAVTAAGRYQRFQCVDCGAWTRGGENLLSKEKRASLQRGFPQ